MTHRTQSVDQQQRVTIPRRIWLSGLGLGSVLLVIGIATLVADVSRTVTAYLLIAFAAVVIGWALAVRTYLRQPRGAWRGDEDRRLLDYETAPVGVFSARVVDGIITECNRRCAQLLGHADKTKVTGRIAAPLLARQEGRESITIRLARMRELDGECAWQRPDGESCWLHIAMRLSMDGNRIEGVLTDITAHKQAEEALCRSNDTLHALIQASPLAIVTMDADGCVTRWNSAAEGMFGWTSDEAIGHPLPFVEPEKVGEFQAIFQAALSGQAFTNLELRRRRKDGTPVDLSVATAPLHDTHGKVIGVISVLADITERTRVEQALRLTQQSIDRAADAVFWISEAGQILYVNEATARMLGYSREELLAMSVFDIDTVFTPDDWPEHWRELQQRRHITIESEHSAKNGRRIPVEVSVNYLDYGGNAINCAFARDVSERKRAGELRQLEEARLEALLSLSQMTGESQQVLADFALEQGVNLTGSTIGFLAFANADASILTMHSWSRNAMEMCQLVEKPLVYTMESVGLWGESVRQRKAMIINDYHAPNMFKRGLPVGHVPMHRLLTVPILDGERVIGVAGVANKRNAYNRADERQLTLLMDGMWRIVKQREAEQALVAEKERLAVTLCSIGDGVIATDPEGRVVMMNAVAERLTGWQSHEAIGNTLSSLIVLLQETSREHCDDPVMRTLQQGRVVEIFKPVALIARDEQELLITATAAPITDLQQQVIGAVLVFRDVTERRILEHEMQNAEKMESLGVLASGIAHDFNNILTAVLGNISLAKALCPEETTHLLGRLVEAEKATLRARDLTKQLLNFSRGGTPVKRTASIAEVVNESLALVLRGVNVKRHIEIPDDVWPVGIDYGQIAQAVQNIVLNAVQAMPNGGTIRVSVANTTFETDEISTLPHGQYVRLDIADNGIGIPPMLLSKIFDPYFSTKEYGTGLGLTNAYAIVKRHEGTILVQSEPGGGSTFSILLPAMLDLALAESTADPLAETCHGRILVMDDEESVRDVVTRMLTLLGYTVESTADGEEAIARYQHAMEAGEPFDAIITDLTVPGGMGGAETVEILKTIDPRVRAIASSGYANDRVMSAHEEYGFVTVIAKPYKLGELAEVMRRVTQGTPQGAP
jgi:PAS domain S-box-containing protein